MANNRSRRVAKEIADIEADKTSHISVHTVTEENLMHLKGSFKGPPGTPYEGGTYIIDIEIPTEYPFRPPKMKFDTLVWHPNVSSQTVSTHSRPYCILLRGANVRGLQGYICLDTLTTAWSPVLTIKSALLSLQSLLSTPEPKDPQDAEVAGMLLRNPKEFNRIAAEWAVKYAGAQKKERAETSGGATAEAIKKRQKKSKEEEEAERVAQYVLSLMQMAKSNMACS